MEKFDYKDIQPFKWFMLENFPFIEQDFDALTNWQLFCKMGKKINDIINSQNIVGTQMETVTNAFIVLETYVRDYFDNLDVQDEINNKLDDMVRNGTFYEILSEFLDNITEEFNDLTNEVNNRLDAQDSLISRIQSLAPVPVSSTSGMTDHNKIYLNTTDGYWYYYNGTAFVAGGIYQSTAIDNNSINPLMLDNNAKQKSFIPVSQNSIKYTPNNCYQGNLQSSTDSITSGDYILMPKNSVITLVDTENYKLRVNCFDFSKQYVKQVGYNASSITLDNDYFVLISVSSNEPSRPLISDISEIISFTGYIEHSNIVNNYQDFSFVKKVNISSDDLEVGTLTNGQPTSLNTRVRTADYILASAGDIYNINCEIGIDIALYSYDLSTKEYHETLYEWTEPTNRNIVIPYDCYVKFILRSHKNSNISSANDLANFNNVVTIYKNLQYSLDIPETQIINTVRAENIYKFSAHRGYFKYGAIELPENTIVAYKYAKDHSFDFIETDVRMTSDHVPIICHDDTINRTARLLNGDQLPDTVYVANSTFDELDLYDYGIYAGIQFAGTKLLTFDDVCKFAKYYNIRINIDCKATSNSDIDIIYAITQKYGLQYQCRWTVANINVVNHLLTLNPKIEVALGAWTPTVTMVNNIASLMPDYPNAKLSVDFYTANIDNDIYNAIKNNDVVLSCYCESNNQIISAVNYGATYMTVNLDVPYQLLETTYDNL